MSKFFIHRPVFAGVIAILIVIAGLVSAKLLAVAQYPDIAPPTVLISATYPGASAETLARTVAAPIEERYSERGARALLEQAGCVVKASAYIRGWAVWGQKA